MKISDFNAGGSFSDELLQDFGYSRLAVIDEIWNKPASTKRQRQKIARELFEKLIAGKTKGFGIRFNSMLRSFDFINSALNEHFEPRKFRGDNSIWAETVAELIIRLPMAHVLYRGQHYGNARLVLAECINYLTMGWSVDGLDYTPYLEHRMNEIIDVALWFWAIRTDHWNGDFALLNNPVVSFLYHCRDHGRLKGAVKDKCKELYDFLDKSINVHGDSSTWSEWHKYLLDALEIDKETSILANQSKDMNALIAGFTSYLSSKTGAELAQVLVSDDAKKLAEFVQTLDVSQRGNNLLLLLKARELWLNATGYYSETTSALLHVKLNKFRCWRGLNETIMNLADMELDVTDETMANLVNSTIGSGNIIAAGIVKRALNYCKNRNYPKTLEALRDLPVKAELGTTPFDIENPLRIARRGLAKLKLKQP